MLPLPFSLTVPVPLTARAEPSHEAAALVVLAAVATPSFTVNWAVAVPPLQAPLSATV